MSTNFEVLLKQLQEEYQNKESEVSCLRAELARFQIEPVKGTRGESSALTSEVEKDRKDGFELRQAKSINTIPEVSTAQNVLFEFGRIGALVFDDDRRDRIWASIRDRLHYLMENLESRFDNFFFYVLVLLTVIMTLILGTFWKSVTKADSPRDHNYLYYYDMLQLITTGDIQDGQEELGVITVYLLGSFTGMIVFAILIGIITEKFQNLIQAFNEGKSPVLETNHALLLGWNESTERVVCQLCFLRRQYIEANNSWKKTLLWWTRTPPATPVAKSRIVIMCDTKSKDEMQEAISRAFRERGISRTRVGWDVICRVGDPTRPLDLINVGAHKAVAISVMMTQQDLVEEEAGGSTNAATFRTVLALRKVLFRDTPAYDPPWQRVNWEDIRIIVPLSRPSKAIHTTAFSAPIMNDPTSRRSNDISELKYGISRQVVLIQDLSVFLNTLIFSCSTQPGLANVFMELLSFDGVALRLRKVKDFPEGGKDLIGRKFGTMSFHWNNAVLVGVIPPDLKVDKMNGMAPDGSRIIEGEDRLVFISEATLPTVATGRLIKTDMSWITQSDKGPRKATNGIGSLKVKEAKKILVCGFRKNWKDPRRFAMRIVDTGRQLAVGSTIHFLNQMPSSDFLNLMGNICSQTAADVNAGDFITPLDDCEQSWMLRNEIRLSFTEGDSTNFDTLESLMIENNGFDVVIVVPPVDTFMSAQAQDTRLMTIMSMLRRICEDNRFPATVHVVGENKLEISAQLALRPKSEKSLVDETDFVNVQAIIARFLCQAMAFPNMQPALVELFSMEHGTPSLHLVPVESFVPCDTVLRFADLVEQVKQACEDAICIGYRATVERRIQNILCPDLTHTCRFKEGDVLMIIARDVQSDNTCDREPHTDHGFKSVSLLSSSSPRPLNADRAHAQGTAPLRSGNHDNRWDRIVPTEK